MIKKFLYYASIATFFFGLAAIGSVVGLLYGVSQYLPKVEALSYATPSQTTKIYAKNGDLIANLYMEDRELVSLTQISDIAQKAIIAVEDWRFYVHRGIDVQGIARAALANLRRKRITQGGSTITQQMARAVFLTQKRTLLRKIQEILLALQIERKYSKDEILQIYLNQIYFGEGAYGIEAAARRFFGKHAGELELHEAALLASLPQRPTENSPYRDPERAKRRRDMVLDRMVEVGFITPMEAADAKEMPLDLKAKHSSEQILRAPYFTSYVIEQLLKQYGPTMVYRGGLRVYTTLDLSLQAEADKAVKVGLKRARQQNLNATQAAIAVVRVGTGEILALVGGRDFAESQFNRAWQAKRQPGSAFKPFTYLAALDNGYTPSSTVVDAPVSFPLGGGRRWKPSNYDHRFSGPMTLTTALQYSRNIPAVKLAHALGIATVLDYCRRLGLESLHPQKDMTLAVALGGMTYGVSPLEMAGAFAAFANDGAFIKPYGYSKVTEASGIVIYEHVPERTQVVRPDVARTLTQMLQRVITSGTGRRANIGRPAAGKTGTTSEWRDAWFIGYTPDISAAVWVGNDDNSRTRRITGGSLPAMIWADFMRDAHRGIPPVAFARPEKPLRKEKSVEKAKGVRKEREMEKEPAATVAAPTPTVKVQLCSVTGQAATPYCPGVYVTTVVKGDEPGPCPIHRAPRKTQVAPPPAKQEPPPPAPAAEEPAPPPPAPAGRLVDVDICVISHGLANEYCPQVTRRRIPESQLPGSCTLHGP